MIDFTEACRLVVDGGDPRDVARQLLNGLTPEERRDLLDGDIPFWAGLADISDFGYHRRPFPAARIDRVGFPGFAFTDGPRGVVVDHATCFPVSMARGATFDVELEERIGDVIGQEVRAVGATLFGGVCVNVLRHPAWGRAQETYGEDPHLVGEMGAALVRGVQRHAMACVKHFACNSMENMRFQVDVTVDEVSLHEIYLPHFKRIVDEGVAVVMSAYNQVNGSWCGESHELLTEILRDEWGFEGCVISDWMFGLRDGPASVRAGLNVEMPYLMIRRSSTEAALADGRLTTDDIDACVLPTIATVLRFASVLERAAPPRAALQSPTHRALAYEAAHRSVVLLRNEVVGTRPLLPLAQSEIASVLVTGRLADVVNLGDGGSSDVWADEVVTIASGIRRTLPRAAVTIDDGGDIERSASLARDADVCVVVVGLTSADEGEYLGREGMGHLVDLFPGPDTNEGALAAFAAFVEAAPDVEVPTRIRERDPSGFVAGGDRRSLRLADADVALIRAVTAANPATVVILQGGSALVISEWDTLPGAILHGFYGGSEGGQAVADVLVGHEEPGGRLPFSVPSDERHFPAFNIDASAVVYDQWHGWWHMEREGHPVPYPFGFGLTYTSFALGDPSAVVDEGHVMVEVDVANTGDREGRALVLVFSHREGSLDPSRLVGFARTLVPAHGSVRATLAVPLDRLATRDVLEHHMRVEAGRYTFSVAQHAGSSERPGVVVEVGGIAASGSVR